MRYSAKSVVYIVVLITVALFVTNCSLLQPAGQKELELKYDNNKPRDYIALCGGYALIDFLPEEPFVIKKVYFAGVRAGLTGKANFILGICDADKKVIWESEYPVTIFDNVPIMAGIEIPNVKVTSKFYVFIWTGSCAGQGLQIGVDDSLANKHSSITTRGSSNLSEIPWNSVFPLNTWYGDKSKVNWIIRAVGSYPGK